MIEYKKLLNDAQYKAVTSTSPAVLVVAGAGSGKTRTIVYRLAWLLEQGISPSSILLLTFTRKAAREMLERANALLGQDTTGVQGGTFHSFAYKTLKIWPPEWLEGRQFTLIDQSDALSTIQQCKAKLQKGAKDRSFPKVQTIQSVLSKARNKEASVEDILKHDSFQLVPYAQDIIDIGEEYHKVCREQGMMDYDDLLFELENLLKSNDQAREAMQARYLQIMVDEYQDTNPVQARIVSLLGHNPNPGAQVMVVGDEAQSIYAFRGSTIRNILDFPEQFDTTEVIRLEENYRSTQPVLDVANTILSHASESFRKVLFTQKNQGLPVFLYKPKNEERQAELVIAEILNLRRKYDPEEIAVLFRSSYHSYAIEANLNREGIPFLKFGGLKYTEAAHIKDCIAYARLLTNPTDMAAFSRIASMHAGIGPKTIERMFDAIRNGDNAALEKAIHRFSDFEKDMRFIDDMRNTLHAPGDIINAIVEYFQPRLEIRYADDWPTRKQGLDEIVHVASSCETIDDFLADLVLDPARDTDEAKDKIVLSTIHSAKGLEWDAVLLISLVEDRFPTRYAYNHPEDFEEERRLMYVACTRARKELHLYTPKNVFNRMERMDIPTNDSPFIHELKKMPKSSLRNMGSNQSSTYTDSITDKEESNPAPSVRKSNSCWHSVFGEGEILGEVDSDFFSVKFRHHGKKIIRKEYIKTDF